MDNNTFFGFNNPASFYVTKFRNVKTPSRANSTDAGCDCFVPVVDAQFLEDLYSMNYKNNTSLIINLHCSLPNGVVVKKTMSFDEITEYGKIYEDRDSIYDIMMCDMMETIYENGYNVEELNETFSFYWDFTLPAHSRVLIPGGIKVTLFPKNSCLNVCNKSGVATKKGLVYTCHIIDSYYTGEVGYGVANVSNEDVVIESDKKLLQVLHIPVYLSQPTEINEDTYKMLTVDSDRGTGGFGSTGLE